MCGIVGIFNCREQSRIEPTVLEAGLRLMTARGPDGQGTFTGTGVTFGHRRLAVIDLAGGSQPWIDPDSGCVLVFNGEIYNYRELRGELAGHGHSFASSSDTEVLMRAYQEWGRHCVEHFSGIFAFGLYDPRHDRLFLARDRLGVKPLFYAWQAPHLLFASSIPALLTLPGMRAVMNLDAVSHYLSTTRICMGAQTLIDGVLSLQPGELLEVPRGNWQVTPRTYWQLPILPAAEKPNIPLPQAAATVRELLENAIAEQMISDVPLGGFLSGGLDSAILVQSAARRTDSTFTTYGVGYDLPGFEEWQYMDMVAKHTAVNCRQIHLQTDNYTERWRQLTAAKGLPLSTPNEVPILELATALRRDCTVTLTGEGSDELFGGYISPTFCAYDYPRARRQPPDPGENLSATDLAMARMYGRPYLVCPPDQYLLVSSWMSQGRKQALLTPAVMAATNDDDAYFSYYESWFERLSGCSLFDTYMHLHARINLESLLMRVDTSTMFASVEARVPFTDHRLAEYVFSLPDHYKMDWRSPDGPRQADGLNAMEIDGHDLVESKLVLRRAFADAVPAPVLQRRKMSFPVPFEQSFTQAWAEWAAEIVNTSPLRDSIFNSEALTNLQQSGMLHGSAMALWPVINLCLWQQTCNISLP